MDSSQISTRSPLGTADATQAVDVWEVLESRQLLRRLHALPRRTLFKADDVEDCPVHLHRLEDSRKTIATGFETGVIKEYDDNWRDESLAPIDIMDGEEWTGYTEFAIKKLSGQDNSHPQGTEATGLYNPKRENETEATEPYAKKPRGLPEERMQTERPETPREEPIDLDSDEEVHEPESIEREDKRHIAEVDTGSEGDSPRKRARVEWADILFSTIEEMMEAKKKKVDIVFKNLPEANKERFRTAINKEIKNNIETGAYTPLSLEESQRIRQSQPDKILQSRYVLVEKNIEAEDIEKAKQDGILLREDGERSTKAKARHVMKGFSEWGAEEFDAATPQVSRESMMMVLQVLCSKHWTPGYLDFTQAFHSGDAIQRELYAEQPAEGIPSMHPKQLLKLLKCCYGLLDGPYA